MADNASFNDRIARIEARAAKGGATGYVTPGVIDDTTPTSPARKTRRAKRRNTSSLGAVMGGLFATASILAVAAAILIGNADVGGLGGQALSLFSGAQ